MAILHFSRRACQSPLRWPEARKYLVPALHRKSSQKAVHRTHQRHSCLEAIMRSLVRHGSETRPNRRQAVVGVKQQDDQEKKGVSATDAMLLSGENAEKERHRGQNQHGDVDIQSQVK